MMETGNNRKTRLQKLSKSDFEMGDGQPDIRGWDVKDSSGKQLGEVDELIFDYESRKVLYIAVDTDGNSYNLEDKKVLVPIGIAELHEADDEVILSGVTPEQLNALPVYDEDRFDTEDETSVRNVFGGLGTAALAGGSSHDTDFYNHEHFNDNNLMRNRNTAATTNDDTIIPVVQEELQVGKKEVETGGIRLRSRIVETEVAKDINLRRETVRVERTAVDRPITTGDLQTADMEVLEYAEVPVVSKEARVVEEIRLGKEVTERDETIRDTVRNTEVDVEKLDGDTNLTDTNNK